MPRCRHGEFTNVEGVVTGSLDRAAEKHRKKCGKGQVFAHPGNWLGISRLSAARPAGSRWCR